MNTQKVNIMNTKIDDTAKREQKALDENNRVTASDLIDELNEACDLAELLLSQSNYPNRIKLSICASVDGEDRSLELDVVIRRSKTLSKILVIDFESKAGRNSCTEFKGLIAYYN